KAKWDLASPASKGRYFEYVVQALIDAFCHPGDCVVDVGANWGSHTHVMLERVGPGGEVFAFEPDPVLGDHLETWRVRHANLAVVRVALSDHNGTAEFFRAQETGYNTLNAEVMARTEPKDRIRVVLRRMDAVPELASKNVSFIKIDVEGEELRVLFGAEALIRRCRPMIVAEVDWKFLFHGEGKPSEGVLFEWMARVCPGGYRMLDLFGRDVTGFEWDAWNVVMVPADFVRTDHVRRVCEEAGLRFFEVEDQWDPTLRFRLATGISLA
ncbi:MAG TPA: FkbM family methyltransferase, partial [Acetobacteraceae bacterium]|nr:FkbM family methyltransferase [Acetobacteraceae bacterium]